ncbi:MAG: hypothetical protein EHM87_14460, partial [Burkholderiales bacterium]
MRLDNQTSRTHPMFVFATLLCTATLQACGGAATDTLSSSDAALLGDPLSVEPTALPSEISDGKLVAQATAKPPVAKPPAATASPTPTPSTPSALPDPTVIPAGARVLYVTPDGDDLRNGCCLGVSGSDGPLRTLQRAQEIIRSARTQKAWPTGGFVVILGAGRFELNRAVALDVRDSGNADAPVIIRGTTTNGVRMTRLVGSIRLQGAPRSNHETRPDLVRVAAYTTLGKDSQVVVRNTALTEARWPNTGYTTIAQVSGQTVTLAGAAPAVPQGAALSISGFVQHQWLYETI